MADHLRAVTLRGLALRQITIFLRRNAQKGFFMEEKAKVTAAPTITEQCGIKYKEVDGLFYPILGESEPESYASLGKYGHRYLRALMENDRYLYNKYFMQGVLFDKAAEYENYAWQLYDTVLQGISKVNTAHKNYKYLDKTKRTFDEQLLKEIMASALGVIVTKLKEQEDYWDATTSGEDLQNGSVSEAIHYFIDTLEWDVSGPEAMSLSIRKFFDQRI